MPELPEVEEAAQRLRRAVVGRTIARVQPLHRSVAARVTPAIARALRGATVERVERRGKHQLIHLEDGRIIHVHFRMSGDWALLGDAEAPRSARLVITFTDGTRLALVDPRALGTVDVHRAGAPPVIALGPEATDPTIDPAEVRAQLRGRRAPIKVALLDQRILAGVGNIYAAEGLWHAKLDPRVAASSLTRRQVARMLQGIRTAMAQAGGARYATDEDRFAVYGRRGEPCRRCGTPIEQLTQAGRSTYFCPKCQGARRRS